MSKTVASFFSSCAKHRARTLICFSLRTCWLNHCFGSTNVSLSQDVVHLIASASQQLNNASAINYYTLFTVIHHQYIGNGVAPPLASSHSHSSSDMSLWLRTSFQWEIRLSPFFHFFNFLPLDAFEHNGIVRVWYQRYLKPTTLLGIEYCGSTFGMFTGA